MGDYRGPYRVVGTSTANAPITVTSPVTPIPLLLKFVVVKYSATVTQNVTVTLNCGSGAAYDVVLNTIAIAAGVQGAFLPTVALPIAADDTIDVLAPAGGGGITSSVAIYCDRQIS